MQIAWTGCKTTDPLRVSRSTRQQTGDNRRDVDAHWNSRFRQGANRGEPGHFGGFYLHLSGCIRTMTWPYRFFSFWLTAVNS